MHDVGVAAGRGANLIDFRGRQRLGDRRPGQAVCPVIREPSRFHLRRSQARTISSFSLCTPARKPVRRDRAET